MGGKKHGQRTKGNTRPSSSGRCAEKLSTSGAQVGEIFGFSVLHGNLADGKASGSEELAADFEIDGDFRMILKKMNKRDPTTRLKAVQEFKCLCANRSVEDLNKILPVWPRLYNKLSVDNDRRVREATHEAQGELAWRVKKNLAPHLKAIMGNWLLAQCDPYGPSASAAKSAFEVAFTHPKQQEALAFCAREILTLIKENICKQTVQTLSDPEITSPEEADEKYNRIISSSMDALGLFVTAVNPSDVEKWREFYEEIVGEPKFWKFAKNQTNLVRAAWYRLVSNLCRAVPELLADKFPSKLCPLTLGCLDDGDPVVAPLVWEAGLFTIKTVQNWWENVNVPKAMLPSLWAALREGGRGSSSTIYPNLLPLINSIPKNSLVEYPKFYADFFNNFREGMSKPTVTSSPSEQLANVTAFMECLRYAISDTVTSRVDRQFQEYLITEQLMVVIECSLLEGRSTAVTVGLYRLLRGFLVYVHNQDPVTKPEFGKMAETFWDNLGRVCRGIALDSVEETGSTALSNISALFSCLLGKEMPVKTARVKFGDEEREMVETEEKFRNVQMLVGEDMKEKMVDAAFGVCEISLKRVNEERCAHHAKFLPKMLSMFGSARLFARLLGIEEKEDAPLTFFKDVIVKWLDEGRGTTGRLEMDLVTGSTIAVYSSVGPEEKSQLLTDVCTLRKIWLLEDVITKLFAENPEDTVLRRWFKGAHLGRLAVDLALEMSDVSKPIVDTDGWSSSMHLLSLCFKTNSQFEPLLEMEFVGKIFQILYTSLSKWNNDKNTSTDRVIRSVEFVCQLASSFFVNVKNCWQVPASEELLLTLFVQTFQSNLITLDAVKLLTAAWKSGASSLVHERGGFISRNGFLCKATTAVHDFLINETLNKPRLQKVSEAATELLRIVYRSLPSCSSSREKTMFSDPTMRELLLLILPKDVEWEEMRSYLDSSWICEQLLEGLALYGTPTLSSTQPQSNNLQVCFACFTAEVTGELLEKTDDREDFDILIPHILEIFYARRYCGLFLGLESKHVNPESRKLMSSCREILDGFYSKFFETFSRTKVSDILSEAFARAFDYGYLWALVAEDLMTDISKEGEVNAKRLTEGRRIESIEAVHAMQAVIKVTDTAYVERLIFDYFGCVGATDSLDLTSGIVPLVLTSECLRRLETSDVNLVVVASVFEVLVGWKTKSPGIFLQSWENDLSAATVTFNVQLMRFLNLTVEKYEANLAPGHWDFILCSLGSWIKTCCDNIHSWESQQQLFDVLSAACDLLARVAGHIDAVSKSDERATTSSDMISEWAEFFAEMIFTPLLPLFVTLAGEAEESLDLARECVLKSVANGLQWILETQVENHKLEPKFSPELDEEEPDVPDRYKSLTNHIQPLLLSRVKCVQLCSFRIMSKVVWKFSKFGVDQDESGEDQQEDSRAIAPSLRANLSKICGSVEELLASYKIGDCCAVQPCGYAYSYVQGYLLSWHLILDYFQAASPRHRSQYAAYLRDSGLAASLCENLFRLMPANVTSAASPKKTVTVPTLFSQPLNLRVNSGSLAEDIEHLACTIYYKTVKYMPALVREWWKSLDKRSSILVDKFTAKHVSVLICLQEMKSVQMSDKKFKNMQVKARPVTREVIATYTIEDISIELVITLAENHPLGPVSVETGKRIGVSSTQWSYWVLQLMTFLSHQNGSVLDGLTIWKKNIDKKFEGVTECHICFYILHATTSQLPRLMCRTCKKKFHSGCLYKWFNTSNNATCPLCRTVF